MLKEAKKQDCSNKSYRGNEQPEQVYQVEQGYQVNEGAVNVQVALMAKLPTPMVSQTG